MDYKKQEIREHFEDFISEQPYDWVLDNWEDLHHHAFNTDYYIIGRYQAKQWLGDEALKIVEFIKQYEQDNFGEVFTDFSEPEQLVNMYTYIIGEEVVSDWHHRRRFLNLPETAA